MKLQSIVFSLILSGLCSFPMFGQSRVQKNQVPPVTKPTPSLRFDPINPNTDDSFKIGEITGNVGGLKAVRLPKPKYPDEPKIDGVEGKVKVELTINENGAVESAKAVSGPSALFESAETAALAALFLSPPNNSPRKGYLIYHFFIETPNWFQVGYDLRVFFLTEPAVLAKAFAPEWTAENELIQKLKEFRRNETVRPQIPTPILKSSTTGGQTNPVRAESRMRFELPVPQATEELMRTTRELIELLEMRLADDPKNLWQFELGLAFLETQTLVRNPNAGPQAFARLRELAGNAPPEVPPFFQAKLKSLLDSSLNPQNLDLRTEIARTVAELKTVKPAK